MAIASGVFWIVFGLLYIWYKAFREEPSATISGTLAFVIVFCCIAACCATFTWLLSVNVPLAMVFSAVPLAVLLHYKHKKETQTDDNNKGVDNQEECVDEEIPE